MKKEKSIFNYDEGINQILDIAYGFQKSRILLTAMDLGIFDSIADNSKTASEIASDVSANPKSLERLLNALTAIDLLEKKGDKFSNSKASYALLVKGNPNYMSNLSYVDYVWDRWNSLTETVKTGSSSDTINIDKRSEDQIKDFASAIHWRASIQAPDIIRMLSLKNVQSALDLGCGSGVVGMEMLKVNPNIELTLFDSPEVIKIAKSHIDRKNLNGYVKTLEGDLLHDSIGKGYDLVLVSHLLRSYSFNDCLVIIRKVFDAMNMGGTIVIHEVLVNDNKYQPEYAAIQSLQLLVNTLGGDVLSETDVWLMFKESMFSKFRKVDTEFGTSLIFGVK